MGYTNVIPFSRGADFYYARANNSYLKNNMEEAITYLKRAIQVEPDNLINQFNLASMFSEVEKFEESNKLLKSIVKKDKENSMPECWYYLAYNYGQTDNYIKVKECLDKYLQLSPKGEYASQAEEILSNIKNFQYEFEAKDQQELQKIEKVCSDGINLVEQGNFDEAIKMFNKAVDINKNFIAPRNNIALCYFYKGNIQEAINTCKEALKIDAENIYSLSNLLIFYYKLGNEVAFKNTLNSLTSLEPMHIDEEIKLGMTYGTVGKHSWAYAMFNSIVEEEPRNFQIVYFSAVAAFNMRKFKLAQKHLNRLKEIEPQNPYTELYEGYIKDIVEGKSLFKPISYEIKLPYNSVLEIIKKLGKSDEGQLKKTIDDTKLIEDIKWALKKEETMTKIIIDLIVSMGNSMLNSILIGFIYDLQIKYEDRNYAFNEMSNQEISFAESSNWAPRLKKQKFTSKQQEVLEEALKYLQGEFDLAQVYAAQSIWLEFVKENNPIIKKTDLWAASLVVLVVLETSNCGEETKGEVFNHFSVNCKGVTTKVRKLKKGLKSF
ncbi:tetratricopeptide repeat protein [Proteinivorax tanatarense]|uniref:Tetratricopeptide repeat protein n=1 Tax=Proteinivorax tanatarense TaxID=1260629 RepID=A0AAU7VI43_9FIRM